jgi:fatty acid desaturase
MADHEHPGQWSEGRRSKLRRVLEERRQRQNRVGTLMAAILVGIVAAGVLLRLSPDWWVPAVGIVALATLIFRMTNWRCPACGEGLPLRGSGRTCRGCGLPLE